MCQSARCVSLIVWYSSNNGLLYILDDQKGIDRNEKGHLVELEFNLTHHLSLLCFVVSLLSSYIFPFILLPSFSLFLLSSIIADELLNVRLKFTNCTLLSLFHCLSSFLLLFPFILLPSFFLFFLHLLPF